MFSLLTLLDDIAATLDDVAVMTKVAIKKTSVLMSDDLAVNAGVITGTPANRELPIVWSIFIGSLLNKVYCIIGVLALMYFYAPILKVILFIGGLYLSFEGAHKVYEKFFQKHQSEKKKIVDEKTKIKGAVRTDLVLSVEIILIAKGSISGAFVQQIFTLSLVGLTASVIIYGLVALLVKIDDLGLILIQKDYKKIGLNLVRSMPYMMKLLGIVGTIAMFLVGGGIVAHTFHLPMYLPELLQNLILGVITGCLVLIPFEIYLKVKKKKD